MKKRCVVIGFLMLGAMPALSQVGLDEAIPKVRADEAIPQVGVDEGTPQAGVDQGISFGGFYSSLSAYGEWIPVDNSVYAWRPTHVGAGWRPYLNGQWVWSDYGWYWDSEEPWSWACYHYGRWYYDESYGWLWTPGYDWSPAWVEWRYGGGCVGWAPLGPYAGFNAGFGVYYSTRWATPYDYWSFVDCRYFTHHDMSRYVYGRDANMRLIGNTRTGGSVRYENGRVVTRGPDPSYVERRGNIRVDRAQVVDVGRRQQQGVVRQGAQGRIQAYRPRVEDRGTGRTLERPRNVREVDRSPSIDTRNIDIRLRNDGRNLKRAEEYRSERRVGGSERAAQLPPQWNLDRRRENRVPGRENIERRPADRPTREANRSFERQVPPRGTRRSERTPESRREWIDRPPVHREMMAPHVDRGGTGWRGLQGQERPMRQAQSSRMGGGAPLRAQGGGRRGR